MRFRGLILCGMDSGILSPQEAWQKSFSSLVPSKLQYRDPQGMRKRQMNVLTGPLFGKKVVTRLQHFTSKEVVLNAP